MGGGTSLPDDLEQAPDGVMISVNQHGAMLRDVDYIVSLDSKVGRIVGEFPGVKISPHKDFTDYRLCDFPDFGNSGMAAVWVAHMMGCCPIVICGVDCYSQGTYWHDPDAISSGLHTPMEAQVERWRVQMQNHCPDAVIAAVSGPLLQLFERYERGRHYMPKKKPAQQGLSSNAKKKPAQQPQQRDQHEAAEAGPVDDLPAQDKDRVKVEFLRNTKADGRDYEVGQQGYVTTRTARTLSLIGKVRILGS